MVAGRQGKRCAVPEITTTSPPPTELKWTVTCGLCSM